MNRRTAVRPDRSSESRYIADIPRARRTGKPSMRLCPGCRDHGRAPIHRAAARCLGSCHRDRSRCCWPLRTARPRPPLFRSYGSERSAAPRESPASRSPRQPAPAGAFAYSSLSSRRVIRYPSTASRRMMGIAWSTHPTKSGHHAERLVDRVQHALELVATAHDQAGGRDHAVGTLPARQPGMLLDTVDRNFGGAAEHREHRAVPQKIDGVVAPFAGGDLAAIEAENAVELAPVESHAAGGGERRVTRLAPMELARFSLAVAHAAPPLP